MSFDASISELVMSLLVGAVLYMLTPEERNHSDKLEAFMITNQISVITPSAPIYTVTQSRTIKIFKSDGRGRLRITSKGI